MPNKMVLLVSVSVLSSETIFETVFDLLHMFVDKLHILYITDLLHMFVDKLMSFIISRNHPLDRKNLKNERKNNKETRLRKK